MRVKIVRDGAGPDGVELILHRGAGSLASDEDGTHLRVTLGELDAGTLLWWIRMAYPGGVETIPLGTVCEQVGCTAEPTVAGVQAIYGRVLPWCGEHAPDGASAAALPRYQDQIATTEGVRFYLRSAYGMNSEDSAEAIRQHPYTIASASEKGMSVEDVAVDIARRVRGESGRLRLEAQVDNLGHDFDEAKRRSADRVASLRAARQKNPDAARR